jgi:hypothetical protein
MRLRPNIESIEVQFWCPHDEKHYLAILEPSDPRLHAETSSCEHCGYEESCTLIYECACGRTHYLHLLSRSSG